MSLHTNESKLGFQNGVRGTRKSASSTYIWAEHTLTTLDSPGTPDF